MRAQDPNQALLNTPLNGRGAGASAGILSLVGLVQSVVVRVAVITITGPA